MPAGRRVGALGAALLAAGMLAACSPEGQASAQADTGNAAYCTTAQIDRCGALMKRCIDDCYKTYTGDDYQNCVNSSDGCRGKYDTCKSPCP
jgi:hypothetical protein